MNDIEHKEQPGGGERQSTDAQTTIAWASALGGTQRATAVDVTRR